MESVVKLLALTFRTAINISPVFGLVVHGHKHTHSLVVAEHT